MDQGRAHKLPVFQGWIHGVSPPARMYDLSIAAFKMWAWSFTSCCGVLLLQRAPRWKSGYGFTRHQFRRMMVRGSPLAKVVQNDSVCWDPGLDEEPSQKRFHQVCCRNAWVAEGRRGRRAGGLGVTGWETGCKSCGGGVLCPRVGRSFTAARMWE